MRMLKRRTFFMFRSSTVTRRNMLMLNTKLDTSSSLVKKVSNVVFFNASSLSKRYFHRINISENSEQLYHYQFTVTGFSQIFMALFVLYILKYVAVVPTLPTDRKFARRFSSREKVPAGKSRGKFLRKSSKQDKHVSD